MGERFTTEELFCLRNNLPIRLIITAVLNLNTRSHDGAFRFECPLCHGYDTATNPATNLGRCFACKKNFNPIDLVMVVRALSFRDAVTLLRKVRANMPHAPSPTSTAPAPEQHAPLSAPRDLVRIGELLARYKLAKR